MAASANYNGARPMGRGETLQHLVELEKQYMVHAQPAASTQQPLQVRRRSSRESLTLQDPRSQLGLPPVSSPSGRSGSSSRLPPVSPLSLTIPTPQASPRHDTSGETTPRKANARSSDDESGDDRQSVQSSICQSPSWEGYGQKKKKDRKEKKKLAAEQKKREKEKREREKKEHEAANKRTTRRLFKNPPAERAERVDRSASRERPEKDPRRDHPPVSTFNRLSLNSGRLTTSGSHGILPGSWTMRRPSISRSTSPVADKGKQPEAQAVVPEKKDKVSYPPISSRTRGFRNSFLPGHGRKGSTSASASASADNQLAASDPNLYLSKNLSDQSVNYGVSATPAPGPADPSRGRMSVDGRGGPPRASVDGGSYVGKVRAQSMERSINGFMLEAALSDPNLLNEPNTMVFSKRPDALTPGITAQHQQTQARLADTAQQTPHQTSDAAGTDYFDFVTSQYTPPTLHLQLDTPASSSSGMLSSLRSHMSHSRRGSTSSSSTSQTRRSFRDRALSAIHGPSVPQPDRPGSSLGTPLSRKPGITDPAITTSSTTSSIITNASSALHQERRLLPKPARVLGDANALTVSLQGSSTTSSPMITPTTSRPHSARGPSATSDVDQPQSKGRFLVLERLEPEDDVEDWTQSTVSTVLPDTDAASFVTTLTNQQSRDSIRDAAPSLSFLKEAALLDQDLGVHPALKEKQEKEKQEREKEREREKQEREKEREREKQEKEKEKQEREKEKQKQEMEKQEKERQEKQKQEKEKQEKQKQEKERQEKERQEREKQEKEKQETRRAPIGSSPLSNVIRSAKIASQSAKADVDRLDSRSESSSQSVSESGTSSQSSRSDQLARPVPQQKPLAKMLVECCHCKFFHDMPSRVYECMAQPDAVVTDAARGVSGAITTMVKCPWCSHNMSTQCCAGYAAVVYLKERLH